MAIQQYDWITFSDTSWIVRNLESNRNNSMANAYLSKIQNFFRLQSIAV